MMWIHDYIQKKWKEYEYCNMRAKRALQDLERMGKMRVQAGGGVTEEDMKRVQELQNSVKEKLDAIKFEKINEDLEHLQRVVTDHRGHEQQLKTIKFKLETFQEKLDQKVDTLNAIQEKIKSRPKV
jgi:hypothetical protein